MWIIFLTVIAVPILEVLLLIEASERFGAMNIFSLSILTAFVGIILTRREGRQVLFQVRKDTGRGILPAESLMHGILIFIGGVLLIIPGFITDAMGLMLLIPLARSWVANQLKQSLQKSMRSGKFQVRTFTQDPHGGFHAHGATFTDFGPRFEEKEIREAQVIDIETKRLERLQSSSSEPTDHPDL
ncbi:MAG: FxsA family protein [Bdellovibrionales bacterium]|nr:FxsA family protein [Bdellovibrionales bacterium]